MQKTQKPVGIAGDHTFVLTGVSWKTYESLMEDHLSSSAPRFTYDRGTLEIMSPSPEHENANRNMARLVLAICEVRDMDAEDFGSTTYRREDLERGFEPDSCFYIENERLVRNKPRFDLAVDPPPDLVIEIEVTSFSINRLPLYADIGVPEVWRYVDEKVEILLLDGDSYRKSETSKSLAGINATDITDLMAKSRTLRRTEWLKFVREAARKSRS